MPTTMGHTCDGLAKDTETRGATAVTAAALGMTAG